MKKPWFKRDTLLYPVSWQGWGVYVLIILFNTMYLLELQNKSKGITELLINFVPTLLVSLTFGMFIAYLTSKPD